ncbi:hypothetical protein C8Q74DRAFT_910229 [Fomes fomentarius]|nr:hypothetical protein C8Q74DRAFT_910229 [Fomes fomentarius]
MMCPGRSLCCMNTLDIILDLISILVDIDIQFDITRFIDPLTTILVYRFLMDLQEESWRDMKLDSDDPLHFSMNSRGALSFVREIGSIGATIAPNIGASSPYISRPTASICIPWTTAFYICQRALTG